MKPQTPKTSRYFSTPTSTGVVMGVAIMLSMAPGCLSADDRSSATYDREIARAVVGMITFLETAQPSDNTVLRQQAARAESDALAAAAHQPLPQEIKATVNRLIGFDENAYADFSTASGEDKTNADGKAVFSPPSDQEIQETWQNQ